MLGRLREHFENGLSRIRWFSNVLSERVQIEISLMKVFGKIEGLKRRRAGIMQSIGEKVYDMRLNPVPDVYNQKQIRDYMKELADIEKEIEEFKKQAEDIGSLVEE